MVLSLSPFTNTSCPAFVDEQNSGKQNFNVPFYFAVRTNLIGDIPDNILALVAPVAIFWTLALFFHCLDVSGLNWLDKYRIHESKEIKSRNLASRSHVFWTVISQHVVQTVLGYIWLNDPENISMHACQREMQLLREMLGRFIRWADVPGAVQQLCHFHEAEITHWLYWWVIPAVQMFLAMFILDTWEYFLHRLMHSNKFLYKHFHSMHHRLYVPYAFGAMYNHPLEGLLLDTCGALMANAIACLTTRQAMFFFSMSMAKGVLDHCGYRLPFDPFQIIGASNVEYHDIHHQSIGMKYNFSQPFFTHWDAILSTRLTVKEVQDRRYKTRSRLRDPIGQ